MGILGPKLTHTEEESIERVVAGEDGFIKAVLLAKLPRLREIKFVNFWHCPGMTLDWLERLDPKHFTMPGFASLKKVSVGVESGTWMDDGDDLNGNLLQALLRLPRIESLYFKYLGDDGIYFGPKNTDVWSEVLLAKSSSVQHIFLECKSRIPPVFLRALIAAPKALQSFATRLGERIDGRDHDNLSFVYELGQIQGASLESLMFYGIDPQSVHERDERNSTYTYRHGWRMKDDYPVLKNLTINWADIRLQAVVEQISSLAGWGNFAMEFFPASIETIVICDDKGTPSNKMLENFEQTDEVEMMVIAMIQSDKFPNLKTIYLGAVERARIRVTKIPFQNAIKVGQKFGVDVHTYTNSKTPKHVANFPWAPDECDLVTGPSKGRITEGTGFNVYEGSRWRKWCGGCGGVCSQCRRVYRKALWHELAEQRRMQCETSTSISQ